MPAVEIRISYGNREKEREKNALRDFPWILSRAEFEPAKEGGDSDSEVLEATEAAGPYRLDAFSDCIEEPVMMIAKQIKQVTLKHLGRSDHRIPDKPRTAKEVEILWFEFACCPGLEARVIRVRFRRAA